MSVFKKPSELLLEYGVLTSEITDVVITHAPNDHIAAIGYYTNAAVHIQEEEYRIGKAYLPSTLRVYPHRDGVALTDEVQVKRIGGHSSGSCIVTAGEYLLCGDECYYRRNLTEGSCTGSSCNEERSRRFLAEYGGGAYRPLLFHDPSVMSGRVGFEEIV